MKNTKRAWSVHDPGASDPIGLAIDIRGGIMRAGVVDSRVQRGAAGLAGRAARGVHVDPASQRFIRV